MKKLIAICVVAIFVGFISIGDSYADMVVDDFESYDDSSNLIWDTWIDGYGIPANGSEVDIETSIVYGGLQSMEFDYDNTDGVTYSEALRTLDFSQDWSAADSLSLRFHGLEGNTGTGQLSVKVNDSQFMFAAGDNLKHDGWISLIIDLAAFSGLDEVETLSLRIDGSGAGGKLYFDDIKVMGDVSVVPVPGAVLLGMIGLSVAGIKLRKFV